MGGGGCLVFPRFWESAGTPPPRLPGGGGVRCLGLGFGLLRLVDHQHCSWAEAHCDTRAHVSSCGKSCLGIKKHLFRQGDHSNAGDDIRHRRELSQRPSCADVLL